MIDNFGREITDHGNGIFSVEGITINTNGGTIESALYTFNAMPTGDYQNPALEQINTQTEQAMSLLSSLPEDKLNDLISILQSLNNNQP